MRTKLLLALAAPLATLTAACGSLSGSTDQASTLATIHGTIDNPSSIDVGSGALRVAVVWAAVEPAANGGAQSTELHAAQDIPVKPVFPASFALDVTELPPEEAMTTTDKTPGGVRFAYGAVVAYEDDNHDAKLDLVDPSATNFVDEIVAASDLFYVVYFEGNVPDPAQYPNLRASDGSVPHEGFNLYFTDACDTETGRGLAGPCTKETSAWKAIDAPIALSVSRAPRFGRVMCASSSGGASATGTGATDQHPPGQLPATLPADDDPDVLCLDKGRSFVVDTCTVTSTSLCGEVATQCTSADEYSLASGQAPPPGWPCGLL